MTEIKCKTCNFFVQDNKERDYGHGNCVINPPMVVPSGEAKFPRMFSEERCGKHQLNSVNEN